MTFKESTLPKHTITRRLFRWALRSLVLLLALLAGPLMMAACSGIQSQQNWYDTDRSSAKIAPLPSAAEEAIVQVYHARAFGWRGYFAVHTWLATKEKGANSYWVHDVTGWRQRTMRSYAAEPDTAWYGNPPTLIADIRGSQAEVAIPKILAAVEAYPYADRYQAWPGPNSNTFTSWVIRQVPELSVALPNTAIGKDYLGPRLVATTPSNSGLQLSLLGYAGVLASVREGIELNLLGLSLGVDPIALGIKLPGIGELSLLEPWQPDSTTNTATAE
ncbi:DUF3750 domain-containing protein [Marinobacter sp. BGYM27]|uniref:DUF3750 domain-containing protein n=1 Tax=unclassified Marinobacter TaxID=83889 RepID=UPI0021A4FF86|nr:DUF3750 domain-containing protein [Marinobacter sp. BGYM27]MDG5499955.1 DUF3750 domain-containing protein [Marinobacter sp. BGYM27]